MEKNVFDQDDYSYLNERMQQVLINDNTDYHLNSDAGGGIDSGEDITNTQNHQSEDEETDESVSNEENIMDQGEKIDFLMNDVNKRDIDELVSSLC